MKTKNQSTFPKNDPLLNQVILNLPKTKGKFGVCRL